MAASVISRQTSQIGWLIDPCFTRSPAVNSSESPGRKKPTSRPHSAKTTTRIPTRPKLSTSVLGSSHEGPRAEADIREGYRRTRRRTRSAAADGERLRLVGRAGLPRPAVDHEAHRVRPAVDDLQHLSVEAAPGPRLEQPRHDGPATRHPDGDVALALDREGKQRRPLRR